MFGPNITGYLNPAWEDYADDYTGGAFRQTSSDSFPNEASNPGGYPGRYWTLDASRTSSVFGKASTVQPTAIRLLPCIKF